jgi:hypothetical protein
MQQKDKKITIEFTGGVSEFDRDASQTRDFSAERTRMLLPTEGKAEAGAEVCPQRGIADDLLISLI